MPDHTRLCVTATGAVVLDLKRNRYFGLGAREVRALAALALNWSTAATLSGQELEPLGAQEAASLAGALVEAGFLTSAVPTGEAPRLDSIDVDVATLSVEEEMHPGNARLRLHHIVAFVRACIWARRAVSSRLLYAVGREVAERKPVSAHAADVQRTIGLVSAFRHLRPYAFATKDRCLFHALALLQFLSIYGVHPTWVIAVRPVPWAAHSWLQLGNRVLDCTPAEVCGYTPIFAV